MNKKGDNKIGIPWYKRNVKFDGGDDMGINPVSFNLPDGKRNNQRQRQRQRVRELQPQTQTETQPATNPATQPDIGTNPFRMPFGFPIPGRNPNPNPAPAPQGGLGGLNPSPVPAFISNPNYDWAKHFERVAPSLPQAAPPIKIEPEPPKLTPAEQVLQNIITPIVGLFVAREVANQYIKVNVTDPIYKRMLQDPVLGTVLREGEKANLDAEQLGTILANFDWENGDYKELEKTLAAGVGVAGAARLIVFIVGRKVVFRM